MPHRLTKDDDIVAAVIKLAEGNPGAVTVVVELLAASPWTLWWLDQIGIYGAHIWQLYHIACHNNIAATIGLLQSVRYGLVPLSAIISAANGTLHFTEQEIKELSDILITHPLEDT